MADRTAERVVANARAPTVAGQSQQERHVEQFAVQVVTADPPMLAERIAAGRGHGEQSLRELAATPRSRPAACPDTASTQCDLARVRVHDAQQLVGIDVGRHIRSRRLDKVGRLGIVFVGKLLPQRQRRIPRAGHAAAVNPDERGLAELPAGRSMASQKELTDRRLVELVRRSSSTGVAESPTRSANDEATAVASSGSSVSSTRRGPAFAGHSRQLSRESAAGFHRVPASPPGSIGREPDPANRPAPFHRAAIGSPGD